MATFTPNLNLRKPDEKLDLVDVVADFNNNYDILDAQIKDVKDDAAALAPLIAARSNLSLGRANIALPAGVATTQFTSSPITTKCIMDVWMLCTTALAPTSVTLTVESSAARSFSISGGPLSNYATTGVKTAAGTVLTIPDLAPPTTTRERGYQIRIIADTIATSFFTIKLTSLGAASTCVNRSLIRTAA